MSAAALLSAEAFELRVLEGAQRGASAPLQPGLAFDIGGAQAGCEVQLRDPSVGEARVRVVLLGAEGAQLEVLQGAVMLGARVLAAGARAAWPLYAALQIGAVAVALGECESLRWYEPPIDEPEAEPAPAPAEAPTPQPARGAGWLALGGVALALAAAALLALNLLVARPASGPDTATRAARVLATMPEFQALHVEPGTGGPVVHGYLERSEQRQRLQRRLIDAGLAEVQLEVATGEQLVAGVIDVFRVHGIAAQAEADAVGQITVRTEEADAARLARAAAQARHDVAGLAGLVLNNRPPAPPADDGPVSDDPGKRIASIVPGDSPYVVTADGTRYFTGALLPSGHRIEAIEPHRVQLARNGHASELDF